MSWEAIGALGEWAGAVAVVATLVYLSIQIRINAKQLYASTEREAFNQINQLVTRMSSDPEMKSIWEKISLKQELSSEEEINWAWILSELLHMCEGNFIQYKRDNLSEEIWNIFQRMMFGFLDSDVGRKWWYGRIAPFTPDFVQHVDELLSDPKMKWQISSITEKGDA